MKHDKTDKNVSFHDHIINQGSLQPVYRVYKDAIEVKYLGIGRPNKQQNKGCIRDSERKDKEERGKIKRDIKGEVKGARYDTLPH